MNLQQELSFKSKPNVWAYFSVKVDISIYALLYYVFGYVTMAYILQPSFSYSLVEASTSSQIPNLVS